MNFSLNIPQRMSEAVKLAWHIFLQKHGNGVFDVNKEASMQLQYSLILNEILPLITLSPEDKFSVQLESGVQIDGKSFEIDVLFCSSRLNHEFKIAIEMKCYRDIASSGNKRGATDIFMKDVYDDIEQVESYQLNHPEQSGNEIVINKGFVLVLNDLKRLSCSDGQRRGKCWDYDISEGAVIRRNTVFNTPIGGKKINIKIIGEYYFNWVHMNNFWYLLLESEVDLERHQQFAS